jgi:hypothetical protein
MAKADSTPTTNLGHAAPTSVEYVGPNTVLFTMKTDSGDAVSFELKTAAMLQLVNLSVKMINHPASQVFRDLDVF